MQTLQVFISIRLQSLWKVFLADKVVPCVLCELPCPVEVITLLTVVCFQLVASYDLIIATLYLLDLFCTYKVVCDVIVQA